ncbi:MAG: cohesin domain-containing protein [Lachnospiraceae bacterium]|nr:cohesin domain-containing protein [Lachnospiraceae bacterium]
MKRKILSTIIALTMIVAAMSAGFTEKAYAASGTGTISVDKTSVMVGDELTVNVNISSSATIYYAEFNVKYDNSLFDFVSSTPAAKTTSPAGMIPYEVDTDLSDTQSVKSISITIKLKAKAVGTANFSITGGTIMEFDGAEPTAVNMSYSGASVQVMAPGSDDATLSSINIAGASLNKAFAKWTLDYICYVSYDTTAVNISATSSQGGKVELGGPYNNLAVGNNAITIKSYAPNGKVMTYNINVVRAQAPAPAPETEPATEPETETETETEPVKDTTVTIDGKEYVISKTFPEDEIPDGYTAGTLDINGDTIETVTNDVTGLNLVYLTDADENGAIYIYDKETKTFEKYIAFKSGKNVYVYLDASHASEKPEGMAETKCEIQGTEVKVYTPDKDSEFVYFYAVNSKGERIWYVYDTVEKTIQRSNNTSSQPAISDDNMQKELDSLKQDNDKLTESKESLIKGRNITFIAGGVVLAALIVLVVVLAAHKSEEKHSVVIPDEDDYDYDNEDDDDDSQSDNAQDEPDALLAAAEENTESGAAEEEQAATEEPVQDTEEETVVPEAGEAEETEVPEADTDADEETEAPETPSEPEIKEDNFDDVKDKVTQADMDAFVTEAQQVDDEPAQKPSEIKPLKNDEDGLEIETEIIDLGDDIFDDDEKPAAKEPEKEPEKTGEEPETIELEPSDGDDEEFFL